ncbi:hypothetical protein GN956_G21967 [Arapaima gigas]
MLLLGEKALTQEKVGLRRETEEKRSTGKVKASSEDIVRSRRGEGDSGGRQPQNVVNAVKFASDRSGSSSSSDVGRIHESFIRGGIEGQYKSSNLKKITESQKRTRPGKARKKQPDL